MVKTRISVGMAILTSQLVLAAGAARADQPERARPRIDTSGDPLPAGAMARLGSVRWRLGCEEDQVQGYGLRPAASMAFTPDGKHVLTASGVLRMWDFATGKELPRFGKPGQRGLFLAISPDGKLLAAASGRVDQGKAAVTRGQVVLWDVATGQEIRKLDQRAGMLAFSRDGKMLATALDREIIVWDVATGKKVRELQHPAVITAPPAFSPDGKTLASADASKKITFWEVASGQPRLRTVDFYWHITALAFTADGKSLVAAHRAIQLLDAVSGKEQRSFPVKVADRIHNMALAPDGKSLGTSDLNGTIRLWDMASARQVHAFKHPAGTGSFAFSPDSKWLATGGNAIRLWDVAAGKERIDVQGHQGAIRQLAFSRDGKTLASSSQDRTIRIWDVAACKQRHLFEDTGGTFSPMALSPDGKLLATDQALIDIATKKKLQTWRLAHCVVFSPDGKLLATDDHASGIFLRDVATGKLRLLETQDPIAKFSAGFAGLAFSPDGKMLAVSHRNLTPYLSLWNLTTRKRLPINRENNSSFLCFTPDGKKLLVGNLIYDTLTGNVLAAIPRTPDACSADCKLLAMFDASKVKVVNLAGKEVGSFGPHPSKVTAVALSPDGMVLAAGCEDSTILLWDLSKLGKR